MLSRNKNDGKHIHDLISRTTCKKHNASLDEPCYILTPGVVGEVEVYFGACGARIKRGGFVGKISPQSIKPSYRGTPKNSHSNYRK